MKKTALFVIALSVSGLTVFSQYVVPQLPNVSSIDICMPDTTGYTTITVGPIGRDYTDLQSALNQAQLGTIIKLDAGATFTGSYNLPNKTAGIPNGWIIITGSRPDLLPSSNTRIEPNQSTGDITFLTQSSALPKIVSTNSDAAIVVSPGANHYRITGIEVSYTLTANGIWNLIWIGDNYSNPQDVPHHFIFDRCYIHGLDNLDCTRGIFLNSNTSAVINCNISNFHQDGYDTQAISACWANGPYIYYNNFLSASGEIIMFGGGGPPHITGTIPSNIEIRNNHLYKPLSWYEHDPTYAGIRYTVKSNFEIKSAQKLLFDGNIIENQWPGNGHKYAINIQAATGQSGSWVQTNDISITNNIIKNCVGGLSVGRNYSEGSLSRILVENNLIYNMTEYYGYENGGGLATPFAIFAVADSVNDVTINHNTIMNEGNGLNKINVLSTYGKQSSGFYFINNIFFPGEYGMKGDGANSGISTFDLYFPPNTNYNQRLTNNVIINNKHSPYVPGSYPSSNYFPDTVASVMFIDYVNGINNFYNYALAPTSPYAGMATDGKDIGVDMVNLQNSLSYIPFGSCNTLSVQDVNNKTAEVLIYPNPAKGFISLNLNKYVLNEHTYFKLYNSLSQVILEKKLTNKLSGVATDNLNKGIYFITIDNGYELYKQKIIVD